MRDTLRVMHATWKAALPCLLSVLALALASSGRAQPVVRVRSESRIELRTVRRPNEVTIAGVLRDDLGQPLASRELVVRVRPDDPQAPPATRQVTTSDDGSFRVPVVLGTGGYRVSAAFDGDENHERVEVERRLDLDRADVRLHVVVPDAGRLDLDRGEHTIEVVALSEEDGSGLSIELLDELDRRLDAGTTDAEGRVRFVLTSDRLGAPGAGRIKARSRADRRRAEAQTEVPIVRFRKTYLTLGASQTRGRPGEKVTLRGELGDSTGPLEGRAVGLYAGDEHVATVLTDETGELVAEIELDGSHGDRIEVRARFESDAPGRDPSESDAVVIEVRAPPPSPWPWLLVPIAVCAIALVLLARRAPRRPERPTAAPQPPVGVQIAARQTRRPDRADVAGRILDHRDDEPVVDAMVTLVGAEGRALPVPVAPDGTFEARSIPLGAWTLRVEAEGYRPAEAALRVPHRGEWSDVRVRLESLRALAVAPFRRLALEVLPSARLWPVWTNREVLDRLRARLRGPEPIDELNDRVERAAYDAEPPTQADVETIEQRTAAVISEVRREPE